MRQPKSLKTVLTLAFIALAPSVQAQSAGNLNALRGLAPVSALENTDAGKAALAANLAITGKIQWGRLRRTNLLPFHRQQQQALRDAFITGGNAYELADGLGSRLASIYQSATRYTSADDGRTSEFTNVSPAVADMMAYAGDATRSDAGAGKYFFGNATTDRTTPVSSEAMAILNDAHGTTDIFGKAYKLPAGSKGADPYGDSRPFQTEPHLTLIKGKDFFGVASGNLAYLDGPAQDLTQSPSFPSGHTTYGYTQSLILALLVPERYPQMMARAAEYGNDRIVLGAHYAMDVIGGRTLATYDMAQLLANKPDYAGVTRKGVTIDDFPKALASARTDLIKVLEAGCHRPIVLCARGDHSRFANPTRTLRTYEAALTYGLPVVFKQQAGKAEDISKLAPEAGYLLTAAFPYLTLAEADAILTATEGPGGGFLDDGSSFGVYSRLDLYRASLKALAIAPKEQRRPSASR